MGDAAAHLVLDLDPGAGELLGVAAGAGAQVVVLVGLDVGARQHGQLLRGAQAREVVRGGVLEGAAEVVLAHAAHLLRGEAEHLGQACERLGLLDGGLGVQRMRDRVHQQRERRGAAGLGQPQRGGGGEVPARARPAECESIRVDAELLSSGAGPVHGGDHVIAGDRGAHLEGGVGAGYLPGGAAAGRFVAQPVVDGDDHDIRAAGDAARGRIGLGHVEVAVLEGAAMAEHEHGARPDGGTDRRVDPHRDGAVGPWRLPVLDAQVPALGTAVGRVPGRLVLGAQRAAGGGVGQGAQAAHHLGGSGDGHRGYEPLGTCGVGGDQSSPRISARRSMVCAASGRPIRLRWPWATPSRITCSTSTPASESCSAKRRALMRRSSCSSASR